MLNVQYPGFPLRHPAPALAPSCDTDVVSASAYAQLPNELLYAVLDNMTSSEMVHLRSVSRTLATTVDTILQHRLMRIIESDKFHIYIDSKSPFDKKGKKLRIEFAAFAQEGRHVVFKAAAAEPVHHSVTIERDDPFACYSISLVLRDNPTNGSENSSLSSLDNSGSSTPVISLSTSPTFNLNQFHFFSELAGGMEKFYRADFDSTQTKTLQPSCNTRYSQCVSPLKSVKTTCLSNDDPECDDFHFTYDSVTLDVPKLLFAFERQWIE